VHLLFTSCPSSASTSYTSDMSMLYLCQCIPRSLSVINQRTRPFAMLSFASHRRPSSTKRQDNSRHASDYNNIDELIRDSTKILTTCGLLPAAAVWNRMFLLLSDQKSPLRNANSSGNHMEIGQQISSCAA
jgi:hypothetical protein